MVRKEQLIEDVVLTCTISVTSRSATWVMHVSRLPLYCSSQL